MNTVSMLGQAYGLLGFQIVEGVVGPGYPQKPKHSAVFAQISAEGSRLTELARKANMTPQSMGELVDELVDMGYVVRRPDPDDGRAKLIVLTKRGRDAVAAGRQTIEGIGAVTRSWASAGTGSSDGCCRGCSTPRMPEVASASHDVPVV